MVTKENGAFTTLAPIKAAAPAKVVATATPPAPAAKVARKVVAKKVVKKSSRVAKKPVKKTVTNAAKGPAKPVSKPAKEKKTKLVRDRFKIPKTEYGVLDELKQRAGKLASPVKRRELLRAGIKALAAMADSAFLAALKALPAIKTGRLGKV